MLSKINNLPSDVLGIRASGEVTENDIKTVLLPALDELAERTDKLNYLLVLDNDVQNFTGGAWRQDMIAGLKYFADWNRIAVVSAQKPVEIFTDLFEMGIPGRSKGFAPNQIEQAKVWVSQSNQVTRPKVARTILGAGLVLAGMSHLTFARKEFRAQVPDWVPLEKDDTVFYSGIAEILLGSALILAPEKYASHVGKVAAGFFTAVFPGNIAQYQEHRNAFGLDTDKKRLMRLFFQPVLVAWALAGTLTTPDNDQKN